MHATGYISYTLNFVILLHKVNHLILEDEFKIFFEIFLNKSHDQESYVTKQVETTLKMDFLQMFENHKLLKFLGINKKFNSDHVKSFYCDVKSTCGYLLYRFWGRQVSFTFAEFHEVLGLENNSMEVDPQNQASGFRRILYILNFQISQMKFEMRILHWTTMKFLYRKQEIGPWLMIMIYSLCGCCSTNQKLKGWSI